MMNISMYTCITRYLIRFLDQINLENAEFVSIKSYCFVLSESGEKLGGGSNSGIETSAKTSSTTNTSDAGKSKKGFSG